MIRRSLWGRIVVAQITIGLILAVGLPLLIDRTIHAIGDDVTRRFLAGIADRIAVDEIVRGRPVVPENMTSAAVAVYLVDATQVHHLSGPRIADIAERPAPSGSRSHFVHGLWSDFYLKPLGGGRWLLVAEDRRHPAVLLDDVIAHLLQRFAIIIPLSLLISTIASLLAVGNALKPVKRAATEATSIDPIQPGAIRLHETGVPTEILPLVHAANELLERAASAYERERVFSATVVHELRTALATISLRVEMLSGGTMRDALAQAVQRAAKVIAQMLELHGEGGAATGGPAAPLAEVAAEVITQMQDIVMLSGHRIHFRRVSDADAVLVPSSLVSVTLRNIIENASRHSIAKGDIEVLCDDAAGTITVSDAGPGLSVRQGSDGRRVYSRADGVASGGSGLGLAIVTRLMEAAGGRIGFGTSEQGGTAVTLQYLPLRAY